MKTRHGVPATWSNWARTAHARPTRIEWPADTGAVVDLVRRAVDAGERVKPVGASHSFTPIALADQVQVRLDRMAGLVSVDHHTCRVTARAGTPLHMLNDLLHREGLALANLGDIDVQTLSGAVSTGTHGTGLGFGGLATMVVGVELVDGTGTVRRIGDWSESDVEHADDSAASDVGAVDLEPDPSLVAGAVVSLGALGIMTNLRLQCVPTFGLHAFEGHGKLEELLDDWVGWCGRLDHAEFFWFPYTDTAQMKTNYRLDDLQPGDQRLRPRSRVSKVVEDEFLTNRVYEQVNRLVSWKPQLAPLVNRISVAALSPKNYADVSHKVYASPRDVRFVESEYAVPHAAVPDVLRELRAWVDSHDEVAIQFPVEVRSAAGDDRWLSTAYGRDTGYIAIHQYYRSHYLPYFEAFEAICAEHDGRPHWGKMHGLDAERMTQLYPRMGDFRQLRDRLDPQRTFDNDYLRRVLG